MKRKKSNCTNTSGRRKKSIARIVAKEGTGKVRINNLDLELYQPDIARLVIQEPIILAEDAIKNIDFHIKVRGGGNMGQAEACRLALGRAIVEHTKSKKIKKMFMEYDRTLFVADTRRKETNKPNDSSARSMRQSSKR